jgi:hypothetical protein
MFHEFLGRNFEELCLGTRSLAEDEVRGLEAGGNSAGTGDGDGNDWSLVRVAQGSVLDTGRVQRCVFAGPVVLGRGTTKSDWVELPDAPGVRVASGLYDSTLSHVRVESGSLVKSCFMLSHVLVRQGAVILDCGSVACKGSTRYSNGMDVAVGPETGERAMTVHAGMEYGDVARAATLSDMSASPPPPAMPLTHLTVIDAGARLLHCSRVINSYIGPSALIRNSDLEEVTLLSSEAEPTIVEGGVRLRATLLQEGAVVRDGASVSQSFLMEHSEVCLHAKVSSSILAPDSSIGSGECHSSLVGPFVGFHHQSLLIASIWPLGRGNLGYGCNVGSNHTSRRADQEMWPGEGMFFGLSCAIKFPANYSEAPYSVVASGVTCLPQRVSLPFSLINSPDLASGGMDALRGLNELIPGWILSNNMYMLARNEKKYASRATARRTKVKYTYMCTIFAPSNLIECLSLFAWQVSWPIFRRKTMELMWAARDGLRSAKVSCESDLGAPVYIGDSAIAGLGKNFMTERSRVAGIEAYSLHIQRYALRRALVWLESLDKEGMGEAVESLFSGAEVRSSVPFVPRPFAPEMDAEVCLLFRDGEAADEKQPEKEIEHWRDVLCIEFQSEIGKNWLHFLRDLLSKLVHIEASAADAVQSSKARDDARARRIVPNYDHAATPAAEDPTVIAAHAEGRALASRIASVQEALG